MEPGRKHDPIRRYAVFLSYRHADNKEAGRQWASWLHQMLESYEIPPDLVGTKNGRGEEIPASLYPVFRDEEELPADADLTRNIRHALENSALLVVLCSPRAVESRFVADEIRYFKELGKANRILALLIDGEPNAADDPGKARLGIGPEAECLPEPLRYGVAEDDGKINWTRRTEPIAADARPEGRAEQGWTTGAAYREALYKSGKSQDREITQKVREYEQRLELAKLKVVAGSLGVPLGELTRRDKAMQLRKARQRARTLKLWLAAVGVLALLAVAGGVYARFQRREVQQAFSMADCASALERIGHDQGAEAIAYLTRALRTNPDNHDAASLLFSVLNTRNWVIPKDRFRPDGEEFRAFDCNGRYALTATGKTLRVWDIDARHVIREIPDPDSRVLAFAPDGRHVIMAYDDQVQSLAIDTGAVTAIGNSGVTTIQFSPDGKKIALADNHKARSWNLADNQPVGDPIEQSMDKPATVSPDGTHILLPESGGTVVVWNNAGQLVTRTFQSHQSPAIPTSYMPTGPRPDPLCIWDIRTGEPVSARLPYRNSEITVAAFSPDGKWLMTAANDETARIWDATTGQPRTPQLNLGGKIVAAAWSHDGRLILTVSGTIVCIWDAATGGPVTQPLHASDEVLDAWFSPDGDRIIAAVVEKSGVALPVEPGLIRYNLNPAGVPESSFYSVKTVLVWDATVVTSSVETLHPPTWAIDAKFSPDGRWIATISGNAAQIWDASDHALRNSLPMEDVPVCAAFSPDSKRLLLVDASETARVWNPATGEAITPSIHDEAEGEYGRTHPTHSVSSISFDTPRHPSLKLYGAFSPDGKSVALVTGYSTRIWDASTGKPSTPPMRQNNYIHSAVFSPDGRRLLTTSLDASARVWNIATQKPVGESIHLNQQIEMAAFSPNGQCIVTAGDDHSTQIWDALTGRAMSPSIMQQEPVKSVAFSPDSKCVVTMSGKTARVWNAVTGEPISAPMNHSAPLTSAVFSPDGAFVLTASEDRTARIWDASTGLAVSVPMLHTGTVNSASFSADAQFVVTAGEAGEVKVWPFYSATPPPWMLDLAETLAGCRLDATGNPSYVPGKETSWLRTQAVQGSNKADPMVRWASKILKVETR